MNPRLSILAVALVLAVAAMFHLKRTAASLAEGMNPSTGTAVPSKTERIDNDHHPDRLLGLDPSLHHIVIRLEELNLTWERNRPADWSSHRIWNRWHEFSLKQADQLDTSQIEALLTWVESPDNANYVTKVRGYRPALYKSWASRDPDAARNHVIELAKSLPLAEEMNLWSNDFIGDMYHFVLVGSALHDAPEAWNTFLQDKADPKLRKLFNADNPTNEIFTAYSAQQPSEAWQILLTEPDKRLVSRMLEGFANGAPVGQDWATRSTDFIKSLEARGIVLDGPFHQYIATRWAAEDPAAALDWFASHHSYLRNDSDDPFSEGLELSPTQPRSEELRQKLKIQLLADMHGSYKDLTEEVVVVLDHLLTEGNTPLVTAAISQLTNHGDLAPWDTPFLEFIPKIPDLAARHEIFLQAAKGVRPRDADDPFSLAPNFDQPNIAYEAVRDLAHRLDLPPEIRAQADAAFAQLEAQEKINRAQMQEDPFAE